MTPLKNHTLTLDSRSDLDRTLRFERSVRDADTSTPAVLYNLAARKTTPTRFATYGSPLGPFTAAIMAAAALNGCGSDGSDGSARRSDTDTGSTDGAALAPFTSTDCADFSLQGADAQGVECGYVTVPEDHGKRGGATIDLAVAVLKATGTRAAEDPIVFLGGGPGNAVINHNLYGAEVFPLWRQSRDVVIFDQRGTGATKPSLDCPEYDDQYLANLGENLSQTEETAKLAAAMRACSDRLVAAGVDLSAYTSAQSALDVEAIVRALGYSAYNLYGISYGTRLALTVMRDVPDGLRSVVLDSALPIEANHDASLPKDAEYAFKQLFAACSADAKCAAAYPNVEQSLYDTVAKLDTTPLQVTGTAPPDGGPPPTVFVTGTRYLFGLQQAMFTTAIIPVLPAVIAQTAQGDTALLASAAAGSTTRNNTAEGMAYSVRCSDEFPFITPAIHDEAIAGVQSEYVRTFDPYFYLLESQICAFWKVREPDPKENQPVNSDVPTLVLAGSLDSILPGYYGEQIATNLSASQYLLFEGFGHGIVRAQTGEPTAPRCAQTISQAFLDAPTAPVDATCQTSIPPIAWVGAM